MHHYGVLFVFEKTSEDAAFIAAHRDEPRLVFQRFAVVAERQHEVAAGRERFMNLLHEEVDEVMLGQMRERVAHAQDRGHFLLHV